MNLTLNGIPVRIVAVDGDLVSVQLESGKVRCVAARQLKCLDEDGRHSAWLLQAALRRARVTTRMFEER